jgi:hypothetical protein
MGELLTVARTARFRGYAKAIDYQKKSKEVCHPSLNSSAKPFGLFC